MPRCTRIGWMAGLIKEQAIFMDRLSIPALIVVLGTAIIGLPESRAAAENGLVFEPGEVTSAPAAAPERRFLRGGNPLWTVPLSGLSATRERPIFSASRRLQTPPAIFAAPALPKPVAKAQVPDRPPLTLVGTIIGRHSTKLDPMKIGIFLEEGTGKAVRMAIGEERGGWILRSVSIRDAGFESADQVATLLLRPTVQIAAARNSALSMAEPNIPVRHRQR